MPAWWLEYTDSPEEDFGLLMGIERERRARRYAERPTEDR